MSILYNNGIPAAANNPSDDQPDMQTNTDAIDQIIGIDHVSFNSGAGATSGHHLQVTFDSKNAAGVQIDPVSTLYTGSGSASSVSQMLYRNQNGIFPASAIRAFGSLVPNVGTLTNSFNCSFTSFVAPILTIALAANAVSSDNVIVLITTANPTSQISYTFTNPNLVISVLPVTAQSAILNFLVLQF